MALNLCFRAKPKIMPDVPDQHVIAIQACSMKYLQFLEYLEYSDMKIGRRTL